MLVRAYGAQESDCISAACGDIRSWDYRTPPPKRALFPRAPSTKPPD